MIVQHRHQQGIQHGWEVRAGGDFEESNIQHKMIKIFVMEVSYCYTIFVLKIIENTLIECISIYVLVVKSPTSLKT